MDFSNILDLDNWILVAQASLQLAYNFWPIIMLVIGYCIYETWSEFTTPRPVRVKSKNANRQYSSDAAQQSGKRRL